MKRGVICIAIVAGLTALAVAGFAFINDVSERVLGKVELVQKGFGEADFESAEQLAGEAEKEWESFCKKSYLITDRAQVVEISSVLTRIRVLARERDHDLIVECESVITMIERFRDKQKVTVYNLL